MKKKSDGTYTASLVAREFHQIEGQHYKLPLVTSDTEIQNVLTIIIVAGYNARVIDV